VYNVDPSSDLESCESCAWIEEIGLDGWVILHREADGE